MRTAWLLLVLGACSKASSDASPPPPPAHHEDRAEPAVAEPPLELHVTIDGAAATWRQDLFERVPHVSGESHSGEGRDTWSLRDLAHSAAGPNARVVTVIGDIKKTIDDAAWNDPARTPIVHRTRRGTLKYRWADSGGKWGEAEVKDVVGLEIVH
jgi:hypothetical protein